MSNLVVPNIKNHADAMAYKPGKIAYNTRLEHDAVNQVARIFHFDTPIVTYFPDGRIELYNGGWVSATTTNRMHKFTPIGCIVNRKQGENYLNGDPFEDNRAMYYPGA